MAVTETEKQIAVLGGIVGEYRETALKLAEHLNGGSVAISTEALMDFHEMFKRNAEIAKRALEALEDYCAWHKDEVKAHFTFSKASETIKITDEAEALRILKEDLGMSEAQILECSKLDTKKLADSLGYNKQGLVNALPNAAEISISKPRMMVK